MCRRGERVGIACRLDDENMSKEPQLEELGVAVTEWIEDKGKGKQKE